MRRLQHPLYALVGSVLLVCVLALSFSFTGRTSLHAASPASKPTSTIPASWPQYGYDAQHTGYNPNETIVSTKNVSQLKLAWKVPTQNIPQSTQPAIANGILYYASGSDVYAFQTSTGTQLWVDNFAPYTDSISPIVSNGIVYICTSFAGAALYALDAHTGKTLWHYSIGRVSVAYAAPTLANGVLYAGWDNGMLYAFNATTGKVLWSVPSENPYGSPTYANGVVYVSGNIRLFALDARTGKQLWQVSTGGYSNTTPTVANGVVYMAGGYAGEANLIAVNAQTGKVIWNDGPNVIPGIGSPSSLAFNANTLYLTSSQLYAFNAQTGKLLWKTHMNTGGYNAASSPTVANGVVYVGNANQLIYAFNAQTGSVLWSTKIGGYVATTPVVLNGVLYVGASDFNLYAYQL